ncbi:hypothetical protein PG997_006455 [Apiospora hydei]|uniref:DUF6536 domain-containing protein n=1 Tax=Apiospora hydei TaxID=1337664 RepID=A0ABR1WNV9_9PEZI
MAAFGSISGRGWRRTGTYNILLALACGLVLLIILCISWSKQQITSSLNTTLIHRGLCKDTGTLNTILHLFLNIISTGILSSSNFFMQIVTSPSRPEIDLAHAQLRSLDIGLQSMRNLPSLSRFKQVCWALLLCSTVPTHLLFNSAIFETTYEGQFWNLTIATDEFAHGGRYWLPGASLTPSGASSPCQDNSTTMSNRTKSIVLGAVHGYGNNIDLTDYWNTTSTVRQITREISQVGAHWATLEAQECMAEYRAAKFRTQYKNLIIIVDTGTTDHRGWQRTDVYDFDPKSNLSKVWDAIVPPLDVNSLWSWASCRTYHQRNSGGTFDHSCWRLLGMNTSQPTISNIPSDVREVSFINDGQNGSTVTNELAYGYRAKLRTLNIRHCLAEPIETCQVRISSLLLLIVLACVITKVAICSFLVWKLNHTSFVTPGDAIESFISSPDPVTLGVSTLSLSDSQSLEYANRKDYTAIGDYDAAFLTKPRRWQGNSRRLNSAVSRRVWVQVYYPIFLLLLGLLICVMLSLSDDNNGTFGPSEGGVHFGFLGQHPTFIGTLLFANMPQLILSYCYLTINRLYTQLQVEQEWNSYAQSFKPLRVSYPIGEQISTYRLQLPYRYSVPLIAMSTIMHWLFSNSLFLSIIEGDTGLEDSFGGDKSSIGVSENAAVTVGVSAMAMMIALVVSSVFAISLLFFRCRRLKTSMIRGGTNSLVLSAACHVPTPLRVSSDDASSMDGQDDAEYLKEVSRGKLRWGAMVLPPSLAGKVAAQEDGEPIMHLGFASEEYRVRQPRKWEIFV